MNGNPLVIYPDETLVLPPAYCGSVRRYAAMAAFGNVVIDTSRRFNKREKDIHRCSISGPNGVQRLTVPLEKPVEWHSTLLSDVMVSDHGEWWNIHWGAICSAYGRTPFFEYYADELQPAFTGKTGSLVELDGMIDGFCRRVIGIAPEDAEVRNDVTHRLPEVTDVPYYQIWSCRYGFIPDLSILDLIFNMGPESPLVIRKMLSQRL